MHRFLKRSRVEHQQEVSSVSGEVILSQPGDATSICPVTGQPSLAPISVTRSAIGSILQWSFLLRGALQRSPRPSCSWPLFAPHLKDHKLSIERRVVAVYVNDVVMRRVVAPAPRRVRFHHLRNSGSDRLTPHQLT